MADLGDYLPKVDIRTPDLITFGTYAILFIVFAVIIGVLTYFIVKRLKFNKKIIIFEKVGASFEPVGKDRGMVMKFGTGGDTIFLLAKRKKYLPMPSIQTGRGVYYYFIRKDGEWINFGLKDFDEESKKVGANFLDKEMRYARVSLQKQLRDRYNKTGFLEKYGGIIAYISLIAITGILMWLLFDKFLDIGNQLNGAIEGAKMVQESTAEIISKLDSVISGGSGIKKV